MGRNGVADRTSCLNLDEEHHTPKGDTRHVRVCFELSWQTLNACRPRKARLLLRAGKAKVVKMVPFTLQLRYGSSGYKQEVSLGIDAGTRHIGVSATTEKAVLFEAEVQPRTDLQELLAIRIDARCISGNALAQTDGTWYLIKWVRRNNRQLHKATIRKGGKRQRNTALKYVQGFRLFDCVAYQGQVCFVFSRRSSGYFDLRLLDGTKFHASANCKHLTIIQKAHTCLMERRGGIPPTAEPVGILPPKS